MKIVILAGGGGTRLFPLSRTCYPKQFINVGEDKSLFHKTVERFLPIVSPSDIIIVTHQEYFHHVKAELELCGSSDAHILLEPMRKNTAPAITLAVRYCLDKLGVADHEVILVTPSDHVVKPEDGFNAAVKQAAEIAKNDVIVTFGIKPDEPKTAYGYIQAGDKQGSAFTVKSFREKPDKETAEKYMADGNYYWNSGIFAFNIKSYLDELKTYQPDMLRLASDIDSLISNFEHLPNISIDYAIAEKSKKVVTIPVTADWKDIGSWDAIYDVLNKDNDGNAVHGDCVALDCKNSLLVGHNRLVAAVGLEDLLVVETSDVVVVARREESQKVKELVAELNKRGRKEICENTTMYRPWGNYTVLGEGPGYKMKKIVVNPGQRLSLQMHYHRSEHWIVIGGTAKVTLDSEEKMVHENESIFVPQTTKHRLENPGKIPLEIIEVQNGVYLEEDDIVRFEDVYGRT
ncbi:mannose-1-phosphate guanylyltransferase/mannose-6-phosphate isomerase [Dendrosporobacter sp. 1207_IL3150]|uniref:mannose-1-phosphate guanylyltransferase/mannose-6-phosphate isomerase n=1 Tax=Dendrosporobacter sp. 1207_IL3150 TaxID=3084054 RepID=UPI002FD95EC0